MESGELVLQRAIATICQSDPLTKLVQQVKLGRMKPTDAGLRAVIESWLETYQKVVATEGLTRQGLKRIDPSPRVAMLIDIGVVPSDHPALTALRMNYEQAVVRATE
jgi:hypothetical protein